MNIILKKALVSITFLALILNSLVSCSDAEVKEKSLAGAYILMFKELAEKEQVDISRYKYLCFDTESAKLEDKELKILTDYIKKYCKSNNIEYMEGDIVKLRRSYKIDSGINGEVFTQGYLLTFEWRQFINYGDDSEYFSSGINFWHGDMDGVGAVDFFIIKTNDGWYIDRSQDNGGYSMMLQ